MNKLYSYVESLILNFENKSKYAPAFYIIASSFLLSVCTLISKMIIMSTSQMVLYRALIMLSMSHTVIVIQNTRVYTVSPPDLYRIIVRSFIGCFGAWLFFKAFKFLPLSEGTVLFRTQPLWTSLIAIFYLKTEKFSISLLINLILCFLGIILISQPPIFQQLVYGLQVENNEYHLIGVIMMLFVSILTAVVQILIKQLGKNVDQIIILLYFSYMSALLAGVLILYETIAVPGIVQFGYLITFGVASFFSQLLMNRAYINGQLSQLSILGQSQVLFGFIFDIIIGSDVDTFGLVGTILIVSSLIAAVIQK